MPPSRRARSSAPNRPPAWTAGQSVTVYVSTGAGIVVPTPEAWARPPPGDAPPRPVAARLGHPEERSRTQRGARRGAKVPPAPSSTCSWRVGRAVNDLTGWSPDRRPNGRSSRTTANPVENPDGATDPKTRPRCRRCRRATPVRRRSISPTAPASDHAGASPAAGDVGPRMQRIGDDPMPSIARHGPDSPREDPNTRRTAQPRAARAPISRTHHGAGEDPPQGAVHQLTAFSEAGAPSASAGSFSNTP
jgi:hypothetical protein